jgi:hypothetical protein
MRYSNWARGPPPITATAMSIGDGLSLFKFALPDFAIESQPSQSSYLVLSTTLATSQKTENLVLVSDRQK